MAAHPEDRDSAALLGQNYAIEILGITELSKYGSVAKSGPPSDMAAYSRSALAQTRGGALLGPAGVALWNYGVTLRNISDSRDLAEGCIERAIGMEPNEPRWRGQHIQMTLMREKFSRWRHIDSAEAFRLIQEDLSALKSSDRTQVLGDIGLLAVRAGNLPQAETLAQELLSTATGEKYNSGNAIYKGNEILGLISLKRGDIGGAKRYLKLSGETVGSPNLSSFGPNMLLAAALAEAGEKQAVISFFDQCRTFWRMEDGKLAQWSASVQNGIKPNFGANLAY